MLPPGIESDFHELGTSMLMGGPLSDDAPKRRNLAVHEVVCRNFESSSQNISH